MEDGCSSLGVCLSTGNRMDEDTCKTLGKNALPPYASYLLVGLILRELFF